MTRSMQPMAAVLQGHLQTAMKQTDGLLEALSKSATPGIEEAFGRVLPVDGRYVYETLGSRYPISRRAVRSGSDARPEIVVAVELVEPVKDNPRVLRCWYMSRWGDLRTDTSLDNLDSIVFQVDRHNLHEMLGVLFEAVFDSLPTA